LHGFHRHLRFDSDDRFSGEFPFNEKRDDGSQPVLSIHAGHPAGSQAMRLFDMVFVRSLQRA
jgi:hypothetical protein